MSSLLSAIPAIFGIGSTIIGGINAVNSANAQQQASQKEALGIDAQIKGIQAQTKAEQEALNFEAAQLDMLGKQELATSQQEMFQARRDKDLAQSALTARSAASGFSAGDPTTLKLADQIEEYGSTQERLHAYGGLTRARGLGTESAVRRLEGKNLGEASEYAIEAAKYGREVALLGGRTARSQAIGTILGDFSNLASRFASTPYGLNYGGNQVFRYG